MGKLVKDIRILNQFKEGNKIYIIAETINEGCKCPKCGVVSYTKHSIYTRKLFKRYFKWSHTSC